MKGIAIFTPITHCIPNASNKARLSLIRTKIQFYSIKSLHDLDLMIELMSICVFIMASFSLGKDSFKKIKYGSSLPLQ